MELWDVYDIHRKRTNRIVEREKAIQPGNFHLIVHACIFNSKGEMLIQHRQAFKERWPNLWDLSVGGSALPGETNQVAIEREVFEELGLKYDFSLLRPHLTINFEGGFDDIYLIEADIDLNELILQDQEVQKVSWASQEEIVTMIRSGEFISYYESLISLLFDIRGSLGAIRMI